MRKHIGFTKPASHRALAIALAAATGAVMSVPGTAHAQASSATESFNIPAGSLTDALRAFSDQTGLQMVYTAEIVAGKASAGASGSMSRTEALVRILSGTGLTFRFSDAKTVIVEAAPDAASGERVLGAVRVQGSDSSGGLAGSTPVNGINGSRDVTATEGTGSYTSNALTVGSKVAASIKDTPMSVSVLTDQQLKDQNITDLNTAMRNLPGVTAVPGGSADELQFYSRGFQITQIQFDGGAAMNTNPNYVGYRPVIDLSLYDHVELVRGASGTFNAYGSPGGVINLVRKKPLDHRQFQLEMQIGSWDWHRVSADLTGPLAFGGKLRGRFIATHQDNNFFYKVAKANTNLLSASLEYDLSPTTLVSAGANYQDVHDLPFSNGLMRFQNGQPLGLPRSTCFCFDFAKANSTNKELFAQIEQRIADRWTIKLKGTRIRQDGVSIRPSVSGAVNPYTLVGANASPSSYYYLHDRQTMLEATVNGAFSLFGRDQKIVIGGNYSTENPEGTINGLNYDLHTGEYTSFSGRSTFAVDAFNFNPADWLEPVFPSGFYSKTMLGSYFRSINSYVNLELEPIKRMHLSIGIRYSESHQSNLRQSVCAAWDIESAVPNGVCYGKNVGDHDYWSTGRLNAGDGLSWPPSVQWRFDLTKNLTLSAIYTDIYIDQSQTIDKDGKPLPPIKGGNFEGELKWLSPNHKLNASLSGYYTKQNGYTASDPICLGSSPDPKCTSVDSTNTPGKFNTTINCCFVFDPTQANISYGIDAELQGEIARNWQIASSYNFNNNYVKNRKLFDGSEQPLLTIAPKHKFQIWTSYNFGRGSALNGLYVGFGAQAQSKTFVVDSYCNAYVPDPSSPIPGAKRCSSAARVAFTDPGRVIFRASLGYKLNDILRLDLQAENLLDKHYFDRVGGISSGNYYGAPRSWKVILRGKW